MANARRAKAENTHVALLRGVNVGGKNRLPMATLARIFAEVGCDNVRTYVQSGNVVYSAKPTIARVVSAEVTRALAAELGLSVPIVTRTAREIADVVAENPYLQAGVDTNALHVGFLSASPSRAAIDRLDPDRSPPDEFMLLGRQLYLHCPGGIGKTKLTNAYFDAKLGVTSTIRNWRTVLALDELARGATPARPGATPARRS